jgi:hypothetical protein
MEKFKSEADLKAAIIEAFSFHKDAKTLHVTTDGQCFLEGGKNAAEMHARKEGLKVTLVNREDYVKSKAAKEDKKDDDVSIEDMTIPMLKDELTKREIAFNDKAKKPELVALLTDSIEAAKA